MDSFSVERFMVYQGRRLYGFRVEGFSKPGIIAAIASLIADKGLDITYFSTTGTVRRGEWGGGIFFIDFTGSDVGPEDLAEELRSLEFVERVEVIKPRFDGFIVDEVSFPIMLGPHRAIILSEPALRGFLIDFREHLGSGGEAMLYHIGRAVGAERARYVNELAERIGVSKLEDKIIIGALLFKSLGYGIPEILEFREHPPYLRVRVYHCIECELGGEADHPFSHYIRGILAGYASEILKQDLLAVETRCLALGDPYCEFELKPREPIPSFDV
mgnify:FL=1